MFLEEAVGEGDKFFFRTAIKSKCPGPITYAVGMYFDDWTINMEHAHKEMELLDCHVDPSDEEIYECLVRVSPELPFTGW